MALEIKYENFDTVAYSYRHNIEQLIKAAVGLSIEVNIAISIGEQAQQAAEEAKKAAQDAADKADGNRNSITQVQNNVDRIDGKIDNLDSKVDTFQYAVNEDIKSILNMIDNIDKHFNDLVTRVAALEQKVGI